jgi:hypothetical protein
MNTKTKWRVAMFAASAMLTAMSAPTVWAQPIAVPPTHAATAYTRYELLAPETGKFFILYDITEYKSGATALFNPIRKGSVATGESVTDMATGKPLHFEVVTGEKARTTGYPKADLASDYIRVTLARPVPADGGEGRVRILKTYEDKPSYHLDGRDIVFDRPLGNKRNAVVLPVGYTLTACNVPSQVTQEADGRLRISFLNNTPAEAPLKIRATPTPGFTGGKSSLAKKFGERAIQTRDIVYFLRPPETHTFDLYHDYTEDKEGVGQYVNVVRPGSEASNPSARNLDTGETIPARILKGAQITAAGVHDHELETITPDTEIVLFKFKPLQAGESIRLRFSETYTDPGRYKVVGDEMVFDRSFGRAINSIVLPAGWKLTNSAAPVEVSQIADGRTRLDFLNPRPDETGVLFTARRVP